MCVYINMSIQKFSFGLKLLCKLQYLNPFVLLGFGVTWPS